MSFLKNLILSSTLLSSIFNMTPFIENNIDVPDKPEISEVITNISNPKSPYNTINMKSAIMDKNLIYVTGFEDGDMPISYAWSKFPEGHNREFGGQSKTETESSEGIYSTKIVDTFSNSNWDLGYDNNGVHKGYYNHSAMSYKDRLYLPNDVQLSVTANVKSDSLNTYFFAKCEGGNYDLPYPFGDMTFSKDVNIGDTIIYANNIPATLVSSVLKGEIYFVATKYATDGQYRASRIKLINPESGEIVLSVGLEQNFKEGDAILRYNSHDPAYFDRVKINKINEWIPIQMNKAISTGNGVYNVEKRGVKFIFRSEVPGTAYVDNIRFGYANKLHLYRDGNKIYEGCDLSFKDTSVTDLTPPKKVENIQSDIIIKNDTTNTVRINIPTIEDIGTKYNYTLKASYDSVESEESETYISTITSGLDGFSYVIDNNPLTIPDNTIDTRSNYIEKDVSNKEDTFYLHIKSIDKSGNTSETSHIELQTFKTTVETPAVSENGVNLIWDLNSNLNIDDVYFKISRRNIKDSEFSEIATNINSLEYQDNTSLDLASPLVPSISNIKYNNITNKIEYIISEILDNPSTYEYFVEMFNKSDNAKISKSNIQRVDILSGVKGLYYTIDNNVSSEVANGIELVGNKIEIPLTSTETYLHIKAVDNNNNESETLHLKISDNENPTLDLRLSEYLPTKNNITIVATGNDNIAIDYILLPNGEKKFVNALTYEVTNNGIYEFKIFDKAGNSFTKSISVTNIDREVDNITITKIPTLFIKDKVTIKVKSNDVSGINHIILPDGTKTFESNISYDVFKDGVYNFTIRDNAGNEQVYSVTVDNIDKIFPSVTINKNNNWTNKPVQININATD